MDLIEHINKLAESLMHNYMIKLNGLSLSKHDFIRLSVYLEQERKFYGISNLKVPLKHIDVATSIGYVRITPKEPNEQDVV